MRVNESVEFFRAQALLGVGRSDEAVASLQKLSEGNNLWARRAREELARLVKSDSEEELRESSDRADRFLRAKREPRR